MARKNKSGTPYLGLGFEPKEEKVIQKYLLSLDISAKQWLRFLVRKELKEKGINVEAKSAFQS